MGRPKALALYHGQGFLTRLIDAFAARCHPLVVVLGHDAAAIVAALPDPDRAVFVLNPDPRRGQLSSLQCGLRAVAPLRIPVFFHPVDAPGVRSETLLAMTNHIGPAPVCVPLCGGRRGHPVLISPEVIGQILQLPPGETARSVLERYKPATAFLETGDPGVLQDLDDAAALAAAEQGDAP
jgi:molybdenum cofactor cytidylyltransferase